MTLFHRICRELGLGDMQSAPCPLAGGYTHRMFRLDTLAGRYAVKLLNPEIMARPDAPANYRMAEEFEMLLEQANLPILPAKAIGGRKLHCVDGQYLYVFDYYEGRPLKDEEITPAHCAKVGAALAGIHSCQPLGHPQTDDSTPIKDGLWHDLADALLASPDAQAEGAALRCAAPMLTRATAAMEAANGCIPRITALCHNDMDPKNVLWQGEDFRIIDLECLGYANPLQELLDLAISWAGWPPEERRFKAFVQGYQAAGGMPVTDAADLYDSRRNHIDWLAYNARRALFDDPRERRIGREQVLETLGKIEGDAVQRARILSWLV